jgi:membrane-associated phospholipid phosphatase
MTAHSLVPLAFDASGFDGSLFTAITDFARDTRWLNTPLELFTNAGLVVFAVLMLMGWWIARRRDTHSMTLALAAPVSVIAAYAVAEIAKKLITEARPCYSLPHAYILDACPARTDYALPSGHATVAVATVAALFVLDRRLATIAAVFALVEGFTRVYVGAHYPHDVIAAALLALPVAYLSSLALGRTALPVVARLRTGAPARAERRIRSTLTLRPGRLEIFTSEHRLRPGPRVPNVTEHHSHKIERNYFREKTPEGRVIDDDMLTLTVALKDKGVPYPRSPRSSRSRLGRTRASTTRSPRSTGPSRRAAVDGGLPLRPKPALVRVRQRH